MEVRTEITVLRMLTLAYRVTHKPQAKYLHPGQPASAMINKLGCHTGDCTGSAPGTVAPPGQRGQRVFSLSEYLFRTPIIVEPRQPSERTLSASPAGHRSGKVDLFFHKIPFPA